MEDQMSDSGEEEGSPGETVLKEEGGGSPGETLLVAEEGSGGPGETLLAAEEGSGGPGETLLAAEEGSGGPGETLLAAEEGSGGPGETLLAAEEGSGGPGETLLAAEEGSGGPGETLLAAEEGSGGPGETLLAAEEGSGGPGETLPEEEVVKKNIIPGIIYLGHIPPRLRPRHIRNMMSAHGEVGRIFLQAEDRFIRKKKKKAGSKARDFTEGWVEFRDKRVAKRVAASLNNAPMGTRKKSRFHDDLWSMKYLHRFKWSHLSERLAIERQVRKQKMRAEVSQAKKETNFYLQNVERSKKFAKLDRKKAAEPGGSSAPDKRWNFTQRKTEEEIQTLKSDKKRIQKRQEQAERAQERSQTNQSLLHKIFNAS